MKALIDGDIIAYRASASCESKPTLVELAAMGLDIDSRELLVKRDVVEVALLRCDEYMKNIIDRTGSDSYDLFISGQGNFRKEINPLYKANRIDTVRPLWLEACNEYLVTEWGAKVTDAIEADDAMGMGQTDDTIICTIDKDLLQVPGRHYNFIRDEFKEVSELEGLQWFYRQMLIGDIADNIIGIRGLGPVKSGEIISPILLEENMISCVLSLYGGDLERFYLNADCLWILRNEGEYYSKRAINEEIIANIAA